jgi:hypothetical protein
VLSTEHLQFCIQHRKLAPPKTLFPVGRNQRRDAASSLLTLGVPKARTGKNSDYLNDSETKCRADRE